MTPTSTKQAIRKHIMSGRGITNWQCIERWKYTRLADIVFCMRSEGISIDNIWRKSKEGKRYVEYKLASPKPNFDRKADRT